jgi:hypothetical protein
MMHCIVVTTMGGAVAVIHPSPRCVLALMEGGNVGQDTRWRRGLRKYLNAVGLRFSFPLMPLWLAKEWEVHKHVRDPLWRSDLKPEAREALARRWVDAMAHGGLTAGEAVRLIAERDRPADSLAMDIIDPGELPERYYRAAWRRSSNGGPVWIDDDVRLAIDEAALWGTYEGTRP